MAKDNGRETSSPNPGWIKKRVPDEYADEDLKKLILFFVINTPCTDLSSSGIPLSEYGWGKDVWKNDKLKNILFDIAGIKRNSSFVVAKKATDMKAACEKADMKKDFHKNRSKERVVIYKGQYNEFLSICYHIRNAFAHGRLAMYGIDNERDIVFALEDGINIKTTGKFEVRSRMILKKSTLLKWIEIITQGPQSSN